MHPPILSSYLSSYGGSGCCNGTLSWSCLVCPNQHPLRQSYPRNLAVVVMTAISAQGSASANQDSRNYIRRVCVGLSSGFCSCRAINIFWWPRNSTCILLCHQPGAAFSSGSLREQQVALSDARQACRLVSPNLNKSRSCTCRYCV